MQSGTAGRKLYVRGIVQGVGFRPFIFHLAETHKLTGWVKNTSAGVTIEVNGAPSALDSFVAAIRTSPPPLARIDELVEEAVPPDGFDSFTILESQSQPGDFLPVSPDVAICPDCRRELFDPTDRRYRYPFINCTNCGPRFTIVQDIPYDRPNTTMSDFPLCPDCQAEYYDPRDRRFHAQPVACPRCGPQVWFEAGEQTLAQREDALAMARGWLRNGKILAVKGLGGFHLACDAANPTAVAELRRRKKRSDKAFALMAFHLQTVEQHALISPEEALLLQSHQVPVVLLDRKPGSNLAPECAPGQKTLGFLLPYTPLHLLLLEPAPDFPDVLVMTSANLSEEPIAYTDDDARVRLTEIADGFLFHNRPIHMRVDDSVARVERGRSVPLRRARGYAPDPLPLPRSLPPMLATGGEIKNTFGLARDRYAFLSHHIGDMENYETLRSFEEGITHFERLFRIQPEIIACDLHPNYLATRYAQERARANGLPLVEVQHHHAHLAACLADNGWSTADPVIGLCFDGTGYGTDGAIWGGEVLLGGYAGYQRRFHLAYTPQPGGDAAVRKPARMALAHLWTAGVDWESGLPPVDEFCAQDQGILRAQLERKINTPLTSSIGRLFDAASALLGVRQTATYEGQAAVELETLADPLESSFYSFDVRGDFFDPAPLWSALLTDWRADLPLALLSARFHNSVAHLCVGLCKTIRSESSVDTVALSGGVWQNRYLLDRSVYLLEQAGFTVLTHRQVPANDGGIALGQFMVAAFSM